MCCCHSPLCREVKAGQIILFSISKYNETLACFPFLVPGFVLLTLFSLVSETIKSSDKFG